MKKGGLIFFLSLFVLSPSVAQSQPERMFSQFFDKMGPRIQPGDLEVRELEMSPDPVWQGQPMGFQVTIVNSSNRSGRVNLSIRDKDEMIAQANDVMLRPGTNRIDFPQTRYRFERNDYCFTVEADIGGNRIPIDKAKEFCVRRTARGWSLNAPVVGPFLVETLEMSPDPVQAGQEVLFRLRLRNQGSPVRANIRIQSRDAIVAEVNDFRLPQGRSEIEFPHTRYRFEGSDHCFTVLVDVEKTPYPVDAAKQFCAQSVGWTLSKSIRQTSIKVLSGTYGGNCGVRLGNVTDRLIAACDGRTTCEYTVDVRTLGDPAPGCLKDYVAEWQCGNNPQRAGVTASPEAGVGKTIVLKCPIK